ncbi:lonely Cys domain-containing protein [Streptomyces lydicus]|nr:lonely Cys domain-containing protein [Streptomyces lydicus]
MRRLVLELRDLQQDLPAEDRLKAVHFRVRTLGEASVPDRTWADAAPKGAELRAAKDRHAGLEVWLEADAEAVEFLDVLRGQDRRWDGAPLDIPALARRVLHLGEGVVVDAAVRERFFALVLRARKAGMTRGFAALAAFDLVERGTVAGDRARHFTKDKIRVPGLNWAPASEVLELDTTRQFVHRQSADGKDSWQELPGRTVPWGSDSGQRPYVVTGAGSSDGIQARLPDGSSPQLDIEEFAELVAADPALAELPAANPIVLAFAGAADGLMDLPRLLAERTGRTVWAHSGEAELRVRPGAASTVDVVYRWRKRTGDWAASRPGMAWDPRDGDPLAAFRDVLTQPLISERTGLQIGRSAHSAGDLANGFEDDGRHLDQITTFVHRNPVTGELSAELPLPAPGKESDATHEDTHASPQGQALPRTGGGELLLNDDQLLRAWYRRKSISGTWMSIGGCSTGVFQDSSMPPIYDITHHVEGTFVPDPLAEVPHGQRIANVTRLGVRTANRSQGVMRANGKYVRYVNTDAWGRRGEWMIYLPEPEDAELDHLAAEVGWLADTDEARTEARVRTLRAVRALRLTFGWDIERTSTEAEYLGLLRGIAALDDMWRADDRFDGLGPFTMDLLRRVVTARPEGGPDAKQAAYRAVLAQAAAAGPGTTLAGFVTLPAVDAAVAWRARGDLDEDTACALAMDETEVGAPERSRMFWARVKAEETLRAPGVDPDALLADVLHLDSPVVPDDFLREELWFAFTGAYAAGRDASDPAVVAAHELEIDGAMSRDTLQDTVLGTTPGDGRNFGPADEHRDVDLSSIRTPGGLERAVWQPADPSVPVRCPHLLVATPDPHDPDRIKVHVGGRERRITLGTFVELVAADRLLKDRPKNVEVVLAVSELGSFAPALAQLLADRLGRLVWWTTLPVELVKGGPDGRSLLEVKQGRPGTPAPTAGAWGWTEPRRDNSPAAYAVSVPPPVSRSADRSADRAAVRAALGSDVSASDVFAADVFETDAEPETSAPADAAPAAVELLGMLHGQDRRLDGQPLDLDASARQILHLDEDTPVDAPQRAELSDLVERARSAGRATSLAALAAFHLDELHTSAGDGRYFTMGGVRVPGLNFSESEVVELDLDGIPVHVTGKHRAAGQQADPKPVPRPYAVAADVRAGRLVVRLGGVGGREVLVDHEEFTELVTADVRRLELPPGTRIVLAIPLAGDGLLDWPRWLADRTGLLVLAHSGEVALRVQPGKAVTVQVEHRPSKPQGDWIPNPPGMGRDPRNGDPMAEFRDVFTRALIDPGTGEQFGRGSHTDADLVEEGYEELGRHLREAGTFVHLDLNADDVSEEFSLPAPGDERDAYYEDLHASQRGLLLAGLEGQREVSGTEELRRWGRRPSVTANPDGWTDIAGCRPGAYEDRSVPPRKYLWADEEAFVPDPLTHVPVGQRRANNDNRAVRTPNRPQTGAQLLDGRWVRVLHTDPWGRRGRWLIFLPEPKGAELDRLAGVVGRHDGAGEASAEVRLRVLRGVRALRLVFGWNVRAQAEAARDGGYEELLRGFAALDDMWRADDRFRGLGRFTLDMFHRVVAARPEGGADPDQGAYRAVLVAAGRQRAGTSLRDFVPGLPDAVDRAVAWTSGADLADEAADALRMDRDAVTDAERSRMFWARVKAEETLAALDADALLPTVLGIAPATDPATDPAIEPDDAPHAELRRDFTYAYAAGWDGSNPDAVAAHRLERLGAQDGDSLVLTVSDQATLERVAESGRGFDCCGRDLRPGPRPMRVDLSRIRTSAGLEDAPWTGGPCPFLAGAALHPTDPDLVRIEVAGVEQWVSVDTWLEMLAADRKLLLWKPATPVVLSLSQVNPFVALVAQRAAARLGRRVLFTRVPTDLSGVGDSGLPVLTFRPGTDGTDGTGTPAPADEGWETARPRPPFPVPEVSSCPCRLPYASPPPPRRWRTATGRATSPRRSPRRSPSPGPLPDPRPRTCPPPTPRRRPPSSTRNRRPTRIRTAIRMMTRMATRTTTRTATRTTTRMASRTTTRTATLSPTPTPPPPSSRTSAAGIAGSWARCMSCRSRTRRWSGSAPVSAPPSAPCTRRSRERRPGTWRRRISAAWRRWRRRWRPSTPRTRCWRSCRMR